MDTNINTDTLLDVLSAVTKFLDGIGQHLEPGIQTVTVVLVASVLILFVVGIVSRFLGRFLSRIILSILGAVLTLSSLYIVWSNGTLESILNDVQAALG